MAPKVNCNPVKLTSIATYFHKSRVAHNIKDLEKHLPSIASINGMQVKDYLQALSDENRISVEKIGSGNWYWSFASQDTKVRQQALNTAREARDKQAVVVEDLRARVAEAAVQREEEEEMLDDGAVDRSTLMATLANLEASTAALRTELAAYSDQDPAQIEQKVAETKRAAADADAITDDIYGMESWFRKMGADEQLAALRVMIYGKELDDETGMLKEIDQHL